jgi:hypothetical protein
VIHTVRSQIQQLVQLPPRKGLVLGRPLHFDQPTSAGHDDIHVDLASRILLIAQIEEALLGDDADACRRHKVPQGDHRDGALRP